MLFEDRNATTYTLYSLPDCTPIYQIGAVYIALVPNMLSMNKTSALRLLCSLSLWAVASTLSLNSTLSGANEAKTACKSTELWKTPQWTSSVSYNCQRVIEILARVEPESLLEDVPFDHEFLPLGRDPEYRAPEAVRTPWKLTNGMISCQLVPPSYGVRVW